MAHLQLTYPAAVISRQATRHSLPECGPSVPGPNEGNKKRLLVGWRHQEDTPSSLREGRIWCWVTSSNKFFVYDESYNRSQNAGQVRFCGVANFTMVRMFHPWFTTSLGGVPQDMVGKDKEWCRERYRQAIRQYEAQQEATNQSKVQFEQSAGDAEDNTDVGGVDNPPPPRSPSTNNNIVHHGSFHGSIEDCDCGDGGGLATSSKDDGTHHDSKGDEENYQGKRVRGRDFLPRGRAKARAHRRRKVRASNLRDSSRRAKRRASGCITQGTKYMEYGNGGQTQPSFFSNQLATNSDDEDHQIVEASNTNSNSYDSFGKRTNGASRQSSVGADDEKARTPKSEGDSEARLAEILSAANNSQLLSIASSGQQSIRSTTKDISNEGGLFFTESDDEFLELLSTISGGKKQNERISVSIKNETRLELDSTEDEGGHIEGAGLWVAGFTSDDPINLV